MSRNRKLRNAFKKILEPELERMGFTIRYPHSQRKTKDAQLHLMSIVYDKWGGGFCLEFAKHPSGPLHTSWGEIIPEEKIDVAYVLPSDRARLVDKVLDGDPRKEYFRYESIREDREECEKLVHNLLELLPQIDDWLTHSTVGPNISAFSVKSDS